MPQKRQFIGLVLDKSGSMRGIWKETIKGLNQKIKDIQEAATDSDIDTYVSLYVFNGHVTKVFSVQSVNHLTPIAEEDFEPKGETAFCDCLNAMIDDLSDATEEADPANAYVIDSFTDGQETVKKAAKALLRQRIQDKQGSGKWTFTFTGCDQDLKDIQRDYGFHFGNMINFAKTADGTHEAFEASNAGIKKYYSARASGSSQLNSCYSESDEIRDLVKPAEKVD